MISAVRRYSLIPITIVSAITFFLGYRVEPFLAHDVHVCDEKVRYVNHDVACGDADVIKKIGYVATRNQIIELIETQKKEGRVLDASVYFRDLVRGPVFGVNELAAFAPASLLKLPLAFVFMGAAEDQPVVLTQKVQYAGTTSVSTQRILPRESAVSGNEYTIEELLRMMLTFSDNASYEVLEQFLQNTEGRMTLREETFQELGLIDPKDRVEATVTVRGYASLFRILYNASFLNVEHSEKVLAWLADTAYKNGLVAGVPEGIVVAHKFGERFYSEDKKELHDCGIIYFPRNPYLLCVMTRGPNFEALESLIREISRTVYEEVDSRRL